MEKQIILQKLVKRYPMAQGRQFTALEDIDLEIMQGEFTGVVGPSGSGKTTLLNIVGSLDAPTEGSATVLDHKIETLSARQAAQLRNTYLGFIFQTYNLLPVYTVFENVEFPLLLLDHPPKKRKELVMEALERLNMADKADSKPNQISGGQAQRVAIARAIVKKPSLVLADEPTANLDAENSHHIMQMMQQLNRDLGTTFLFSTHDEKVMQYLQRKIRLVDGKIAADEQLVAAEAAVN